MEQYFVESLIKVEEIEDMAVQRNHGDGQIMVVIVRSNHGEVNNVDRFHNNHAVPSPNKTAEKYLTNPAIMYQGKSVLQ